MTKEAISTKPWIGFDLDGTLAMKVGAWKGISHIGEPIPSMVKLAKQLHREGQKVKIFTARVAPREISAKENSEPGFGMRGYREISEPFEWVVKKGSVGMSPNDFYKKYASDYITEWCKEHLGFTPEITCVKDQYMEYMYDDRAKQVIENRGIILENSYKGAIELLDRLCYTVTLLVGAEKKSRRHMTRDEAEWLGEIEQQVKEIRKLVAENS